MGLWRRLDQLEGAWHLELEYEHEREERLKDVRELLGGTTTPTSWI